MNSRFLAALLAPWLALLSMTAAAAISVTPVSSQHVSVIAGETHVFSVRLVSPAGQLSVGETVRFSNDACGFFPNNTFNDTAVTDAAGVASISFVALRTGSIRCTVSASAGASAYFDVLTYPLSNAYLVAGFEPAEPRPGQPFTLVASAKVGIYELYDVDITARVVAGTASATLPSTSGNSGQSGTAMFQVQPDARLGDYEIELAYRGKTQRIPIRAPANPWQDLWWSGSAENGWGMSVVQHRDILFSIIYAYDNAGKAVWYVMPDGQWNAQHTSFSGPVYLPKGSPFSAYDVSRFDGGAPVGTLTLTFNNQANDATLDYVINGVAGRKAIQRIPYGQGGTSPVGNVGDLWWGGIAQNGWGIAMLQSGRNLFSLWFTYDDAGNATWFSMPGGYWRDAKHYDGTIYRSTGSPWAGRTYDVNAFSNAEFGYFTMRFNDDGTVTFLYALLDGRSGALPLTRIPF